MSSSLRLFHSSVVVTAFSGSTRLWHGGDGEDDGRVGRDDPLRNQRWHKLNAMAVGQMGLKLKLGMNTHIKDHRMSTLEYTEKAEKYIFLSFGHDFFVEVSISYLWNFGEMSTCNYLDWFDQYASPTVGHRSRKRLPLGIFYDSLRLP